MIRGHLRVYLGAAPGVGKTFVMLGEGQRRLARGTDVVIGFVDTHGRSNTEDAARGLEVIARKQVAYGGGCLEEMDLEAVLARRPQVVLVDDFAHTNVPGSGPNEERWQDIEALRDAGIDVISTLNIQHLASLHDVVERVTRTRIEETVPDSVVRRADQIELVDMTPEALQRRMAHGNVVPADQVAAAVGNYFRVENLGALRDLALRWVADRADEELTRYRVRQGITEPWETRERVVVGLTGAPDNMRLLRRGARMAARMQGELVAVHVDVARARGDAPADVEDARRMTAELGGRFVEVTAPDPAEALVSVARAENATQLVLGATAESRWRILLHGSVINGVLRAAGDIDVHVISPTRPEVRRPPLRRVRAATPRSRHRRLWAWVLAVAVVPLLAVAMIPLRGSSEGLAGVLLILLFGTLVTAIVGGARPALVAAGLGLALADWLFVEPIHSLRVNRTSDLIILVVFLAVAVIGAVLTDRLTRRTFEVTRARGEAELLARLAAASVLPGNEALPEVLGQLRTAFELEAVALLVPEGDGWRIEAAAGGEVLSDPADADLVEVMSNGSLLAARGIELSADDRRLVSVFATQLCSAQDRIRLQHDASEAALLADANSLRTAILAAVSHDLRTPLASIKAAATSILSPEVDWSPEAINIFAETIDEESNRLNNLVGNLLNMSRIQTGSLRPSLAPVGLDEVTFAAVGSLSRETTGLAIDVPENLPRVRADAALLERAVANLIDNAINWSPGSEPVRVLAGAVGATVDLRVVDRGPGIPVEQREAVFRPFQRLDDGATAHTNGVGLGLAVARGFVDAMGGELRLEDTPGGGVTMIVSLPIAS